MATTAAAGATTARIAAIRFVTRRAYVSPGPPGGGSVIIAPVLEALFWLSVGLLVYTHVGYPLLLALLTRTLRRGSDPFGSVVPSVSLLVAAYNEAAVIAR